MSSARWRRMVLSALLGAFVFGGWAFVANLGHPEHRLNSALAQAAFSFVFSFIVVGLAEAVYLLRAGRAGQAALAVVLPWATSVLCGALVHRAAHTPSLGLTILGPAVAGLAFGTAYVLNLRRVDPRRAAFIKT